MPTTSLFGKNMVLLEPPQFCPFFQGVFSIVDIEKNMQEEVIDKINIIYAKDYNLILGFINDLSKL
ncbi:hypothetical protein N9K77_00760 [bacterium]|nr:hypothetical protein [bacterium]